MNQTKKRNRFFTFIACVTVYLSINHNVLAQNPQTFLTDIEKVGKTKQQVITNPSLQKTVQQLSKDADGLLDKKIYSVVDKKFMPPCGNMHEYMSMASYYWPDPSQPDGLPYMRKDGQRNPENSTVTDHKGLDDLISYVSTLSWSYYFNHNEQHANKAISLLRFWFIDTATKMLPNLNHAQIIRGIDTGRGTGIIDIHLLPKLIDAIGVLEDSKLMKQEDINDIHTWFRQFLFWLQHSKNGIDESNSKNNHKTYYETLVLSVALFCGDDAAVNKILNNAKNLLASQIQPDGKQPLELVRTNALSYSTFNLRAWFMMASMAEKRHVDLWNYQALSGASIKKALDFILPYALKEQKWPYQQIGGYEEKDLYNLLVVAAEKFKDKNYLALAERIEKKDASALTGLVYR
jgi:hypothetical protein